MTDTSSATVKLFSIRPGTEVGVASTYDEKTKKMVFLGWGIYEGDFAFHDVDSNTPIQTPEERTQLLRETGMLPVPRIRMNDGTILWGVNVLFDIRDVVLRLLQTIEHLTYEQPERFVSKQGTLLSTSQNFEEFLITNCNFYNADAVLSQLGTLN